MSTDGRLVGAPLPGLPEAGRRRVGYDILLPNVMLCLHPDYVVRYLMRPLAVDRTTIRCDWLFSEETLSREGFDPGRAVEFWHTTNQQDWHVSELAQQGIASSAYRPGPYSNREDHRPPLADRPPDPGAAGERTPVQRGAPVFRPSTRHPGGMPASAPPPGYSRRPPHLLAPRSSAQTPCPPVLPPSLRRPRAPLAAHEPAGGLRGRGPNARAQLAPRLRSRPPADGTTPPELRTRLGPGRRRLLELGAGGGHLLHHLAGDFEATAVDLSEAMLAHSRRLNPGVTHHVGDMRTVRLGETFDAVLIHDAIDYMTTEDDLRAAFATARAHLGPGGLFLAIPDDYVETFTPPCIAHETRRRDGAELTYVEYSTDPDPSDTEIETVYVFFFRENGQLRVEVDRHTTGLFPVGTWERLLLRSPASRRSGSTTPSASTVRRRTCGSARHPAIPARLDVASHRIRAARGDPPDRPAALLRRDRGPPTASTGDPELGLAAAPGRSPAQPARRPAAGTRPGSRGGVPVGRGRRGPPRGSGRDLLGRRGARGRVRRGRRRDLRPGTRRERPESSCPRCWSGSISEPSGRGRQHRPHRGLRGRHRRFPRGARDAGPGGRDPRDAGALLPGSLRSSRWRGCRSCSWSGPTTGVGWPVRSPRPNASGWRARRWS